MDDDINERIRALMKDRPRRPSLREVLLARAKDTFPFPPQPFCENWVTWSLVEEVLEEAGYRNFELFITEKGTFVVHKQRRGKVDTDASS